VSLRDSDDTRPEGIRMNLRTRIAIGCLFVPLVTVAVGCAPRRPVSLDYVPTLTVDTVNCRQAELLADDYVKKLRAGYPLSKYSDCRTIAVVAAKFDSAGGPCPEPEWFHTVDSAALKEWFAPCVQIVQDANVYASKFQEYAATEQAHSLSWRDALVILGAAAIASGR
jgi:hypothetical protein